MDAQSIVGSIITLFVAVAACNAAPAEPGASAPASTHPAIPTSAEQEAASLRISALFKDDISKAKKPADRVALAKKLLQTGIDEQNDGAGRYVVLMMARATSAAAGNADIAMDALDEIEKFYQIDTLQWKVDSLAAAGKAAGTADAQKSLALRADQVLDVAIAAEQFDFARKIADVALLAAHKADDPALVQTAMARAKETSASAQAYHDAAKATVVLQTNPADAGANLAAGRYRCLIKSDWDAGIPFLSRGSDATLKAIAVKELGKPTDNESQMMIGDDWWNLAAKESGLSKRRMQEHAGAWYKLAQPSAGGLVLLKIQRRLAEAGAEPTEPAKATAGAPSHNPTSACTIELKIDSDVEIGDVKVDALIWSNRKHVFTEVPKAMNGLVFTRYKARASPKKYTVKALTPGWLYFFGEQTDKSLGSLRPRLEDLKGALKGPFVPELLRMRVKQGEQLELSGYEVHMAAATITVAK